MKRLSMLVAVLAIVAMQSVAQQGFTVTMPKFEQIVSSLSDRVNLRSQPNVKSKRVGIIEKGRYMAVIKESGDWYEVFTNLEPEGDYMEMGKIGYETESQMGHVGFIMKKFCHDAELVDKNDEFELIQKGRHANVCFEQKTFGFVHELWVGKKVGKYFVIDHRIPYDDIKTSVKREEGTPFDFSKMSEREITNIISQTEVTDMGAYIAFWLQGETHPQYIYYSPKEDRGLIKMETK